LHNKSYKKNKTKENIKYLILTLFANRKQSSHENPFFNKKKVWWTPKLTQQ
jgi:hypothetical protein